MQTEGTEAQGRKLSKEGAARAQAEQQGQLSVAASVAEGWVWSVNRGPGGLGDSQVGGSIESKMGEEK